MVSRWWFLSIGGHREKALGKYFLLSKDVPKFTCNFNSICFATFMEHPAQTMGYVVYYWNDEGGS